MTAPSPLYYDENDVARLERTRLYYKNFMRKYRQKQKDEASLLRVQVEELQKELEKQNRTSLRPLSWKDVALALREDLESAKLKQNTLRNKAHRTQETLLALYSWVVAMAQPPTNMKSNVSTWRNNSLLAHPDARNCGKEWIMRQMLETSDQTFQRQGFPPLTSDATFYDLDVQFSEECFYIIARRQLEQYAAFEPKVARFRELLLDNMLLNGLIPVGNLAPHEETKATLLRRFKSPITGEFINLLSADFCDENRACFFAQNIIDDDSINADLEHQRHRTFWAEIHKIDDTRVKIRMLYILSQAFTKKSGYVPLDVDAPRYHCDVQTIPEQMKETIFRQQLLQIFSEANVDKPPPTKASWINFFVD